jgi:predicted transcriptional regulator
VAGSTHTAVTVIGSRVPVAFAERVRRAAEAEDRSVSYLIKRALEREVQRTEAEQTVVA